MSYQEVLTFWFEETEPKQRFMKDETFDTLIKKRFSSTHQAIVAGETAHWRDSIYGRLAEVIVLDQFSRNMFRDTSRSFQYDSLALILSQEAIRTGNVDDLTSDEKAFLYMPFMHSESPIIHEQAMILFATPGLESYLDFEIKHKAIIDRFGRYPHRNVVLDRLSTDEELIFLTEPDSSF